MPESNHATALVAYYLAPPRPSPAATSLSAQFHYAMSSWTPGARVVFALFLAVVIGGWIIGRRAIRNRQQ